MFFRHPPLDKCQGQTVHHHPLTPPENVPSLVVDNTETERVSVLESLRRVFEVGRVVQTEVRYQVGVAVRTLATF
jgi:phosphoenolpyruvate synthase/pyruvate phosphate dikinase